MFPSVENIDKRIWLPPNKKTRPYVLNSPFYLSEPFFYPNLIHLVWCTDGTIRPKAWYFDLF